MYKTATGTLGRVCGDLEREGTRAGDVKSWEAGGKIGGKSVISFFEEICYLWSTLDSIVQNHNITLPWKSSMTIDVTKNPLLEYWDRKGGGVACEYLGLLQ